jgi:hypothetical protein
MCVPAHHSGPPTAETRAIAADIAQNPLPEFHFRYPSTITVSGYRLNA